MAEQQPVAHRALIARIEAATKQADHGDQAALALVAQVFDVVPSVWDAYGDLAAAAEAAVVDLWSADSTLKKEGLRRRLAAMRVELAGPEASPLERLLAERVVACWLHSYHADFAYARAVRILLRRTSSRTSGVRIAPPASTSRRCAASPRSGACSCRPSRSTSRSAR